MDGCHHLPFMNSRCFMFAVFSLWVAFLSLTIGLWKPFKTGAVRSFTGVARSALIVLGKGWFNAQWDFFKCDMCEQQMARE